MMKAKVSEGMKVTHRGPNRVTVKGPSKPVNCGDPIIVHGHAKIPLDDRGIDALVEFAYRYKAAWTDWPLDYTDLRTGQKAGVRFSNVHDLKEFLLKYRADAEIYLRRKQREHELEQRLARSKAQ